MYSVIYSKIYSGLVFELIIVMIMNNFWDVFTV